MSSGTQNTTKFLAVALENAELREQLAEVQNQCIELAVDAGGLYAGIKILRTQLLAAELARDHWHALAEQRLAS